MLLADAIPAATESQIVTALLGLAALGGILLLAITIAEKLKALFFPPQPPHGDTYVTHDQFQEYQNEQKKAFEAINANINSKYDRLDDTVSSKYRDIERTINQLALRCERFAVLLEIMKNTNDNENADPHADQHSKTQ